MNRDECKELAIKYHVEDIASTLIPGSRLSNILKYLKSGKPISSYTLEYLRTIGLLALLQYCIKQESASAEFLKSAEQEKSKRRLEAEAKFLKEQTKLKERRKRAEEKKRIPENDPKNRAKRKQDALSRKYGFFHFIEKTDLPKLMKILSRVDDGVRLAEDQVGWLFSKEGEKYFTTELREGHHKNEAVFYAGEFKKRKNPWAAVNASSQYRKCNEAKTADSLLSAINVSGLKNVRLKSALCTTHGGVKRDLKKWGEALRLGEQAHTLTPQNFRPCTLLGAVNMERGHYDLGRSWYDEAVKLGYSERAVDGELRSIFMRAKKSNKEKLRDYLLKLDPIRYSWAKKKQN